MDPNEGVSIWSHGPHPSHPALPAHFWMEFKILPHTHHGAAPADLT